MDKIKITQEELKEAFDIISKYETTKLFTFQFTNLLYTISNGTFDDEIRKDNIFAYLAVKETVDSFEEEIKKHYEIVEGTNA